MPEVHPQEIPLVRLDDKGKIQLTVERLALTDEYWNLTDDSELLAEQYEEALDVQAKRQAAALSA